MFSFFKKFKQQADSDNEKEKSASPVTPARHRSRKVQGLAELPADLKDTPDSHFKVAEVTEKMPDSHSPELFEETSDKFMPEELVEHSPELPINGETLQQLVDLEEQVRELENDKRSLVNQEARFQEQLAELSAQLRARDDESNGLRFQMEDLQRDVLIKGSGMERLQAELAAAHKESECVRRRLRQLEDDLTNFKQQNHELQDELERRAQAEAEREEESSEEESSEQDSSMQELENKVQDLEEKVHEQEVKAQELEQQLKAVQVERDGLEQQRMQIEDKVQDQEGKVKELERQLQVIKLERDELEKQRARMETERDEEMKIIQFALEEALEEKALVKCQFERDFEKLRTVNTDREQQLLDDFEWKLREVEQACKRRLEEKDKLRKDVEIKLKLAQQQLTELPQLKTFEEEVKQLRGLTQEQQRSLRVSSRQTEQLQTSERLLKEDIARLKTQLDKEKGNYICMVSLNEKKITDLEKKFQTRLDQQKTEITSQWEDRLRRECSRLKAELDQLHREEKHLAVESAKVQKDQELCTAKQGWERRVDDFLKEIAALKEQLEDKDTYYHQEMENAQTNADRDIFDLRRKLDKIDLTYQEQMEKLNEKHEKEIEQLNWESERKIQQLEQNWQLQMSSTRTTLELVKEQMERDAQDRLDEAERHHQKQLDMQWERLTNDKEKAIAEMDDKLRNLGHGPHESELLETIANLKKQLQGQTGVINDLQNNVDLLQGGMQVLNQEISTHNQDMQRVQKQADIKFSPQDGSSFTTFSLCLIPIISWFLTDSFSITLSSLLIATAILLYRGI